MYDLFYIIEVRPQWYNLILKDTHYCVACGDDLEKIKKALYNYVRKYKVADRVYRTMKGLTDRGEVCPKTFEYRQKDYDEGKHLVFNDLVRGVVEQALKDNRKDTPYHHAKRKVKTIAPIGMVASPLSPTQEGRSVGKIVPRKIKRTMTSVVSKTE